MKSTLHSSLLFTAGLLMAGSACAGDNGTEAKPKKATPRKTESSEVRHDPNRWNYQPLTYMNVRIGRARTGAPWMPGAPGD
jgi:hypothetical protein